MQLSTTGRISPDVAHAINDWAHYAQLPAEPAAQVPQIHLRRASDAAAQLGAKMTEVLAPMLTPQALFGTDECDNGMAPATTVGGATQRGRDSTIGEGSGAALHTKV